MRPITYIVIHTTATQQNATIAAIQAYWRNTLGWKSPGYHLIVDTEGKVTRLAEDSQVTNGVAGYNGNALHISFIGGIDAAGKPKDTRTTVQKYAIAREVLKWKEKYPNAIVMGHRDFPGVAKACPCHDAKAWWARIEAAIKS